jgi:hypothetical protein
MQVPINSKSPNNISKWQMGFNSAFKGLTDVLLLCDFPTAEMNSTEGLVELPETILLYFWKPKFDVSAMLL